MTLDHPRVLCWFSCGSASAVAAKLAIEKYGDKVEVLYCDTLAYEHPDNFRFLSEVAVWLGKPVKVLKSTKYTDIYDVFEKTKYLVGPMGARCTVEMKKVVRKAYQKPDDLHIFGFTADEKKRIDRFNQTNPELFAEFPLYENGIDKKQVHKIIADAGIEQPAMYKLGYNNNNCIGCVKGGMKYWGKIKQDFPDSFDRMAKLERKLDVAINHRKAKDGTRIRVFLDELDPKFYKGEKEKDIECGVLCGQEEFDLE